MHIAPWNDNLKTRAWLMLFALTQVLNGLIMLVTLGTLNTSLPLAIARQVARSRLTV